MPKYLIRLTVFVLTAGSIVAAAQAGQEPKPPAPPASKKIQLFNGRNLDGWYTYLSGPGKNLDNRKVFTLHDGMIHVSGQIFGYLSTVNEYSNYRFSVDFKWGEKKWPPRETSPRDAGILYHVTADDLVWPNAMECQIQEGDVGDLYLITGDTMSPTVSVLGQEYGGAPNYVRVEKWKNLEKPHGEWNTVQIVARGNEFEHWINGKLNLKGRDASLTRGRIQLQSQGAEIYYRNITLEPLD